MSISFGEGKEIPVEICYHLFDLALSRKDNISEITNIMLVNKQFNCIFKEWTKVTNHSLCIYALLRYNIYHLGEIKNLDLSFFKHNVMPSYILTIRKGILETFQFLLSIDDKKSNRWSNIGKIHGNIITFIDTSIKYNRLDFLKWICNPENISKIGMEYYNKKNTTLTFAKFDDEYVKRDPNFILNWLKRRKRTCNLCIKYGHLEILQWLYEQGYTLTSSAFTYAAAEGHVHILELLHSKGCPCEMKYIWHNISSEETFERVAEWLIEKNFPFDPNWVFESKQRKFVLSLIESKYV